MINEKLREQSLEWWRGLTIDEQKEMVNKHFPKVDFLLITTSSRMIEWMYKSEKL